jgi:serine protease Do
MQLAPRKPLHFAACAAIAGLLIFAWQASAADHRKTPLVKAVAQAQASVVNIRGEKTVAADAAERSFGAPEVGRRVNGMGSGVVIDPRGYVLTNLHVVDGVRKIKVTLADGQAFVAKLVGQDDAADLAIIKIDGAGILPVIDIGTSSDLMLGEEVAALGNPYGYEHSVTRGIVSSLRRTVQVTDTLIYEDLIQTDASINPGNSGGPLLNVEGKQIGVVVAVRAGAQGIAFAIPIDKAMESAANMVAKYGTRLTHGATFRDDTTDPENLRLIVDRVQAGSPADQAGLRAADVITTVDALIAVRRLDFERSLLGHKAGDELALAVRRGGDVQTLKLRLSVGSGTEETAGDPIWRVLGLRLEVVPSETFKKYNTRYRGGLKVREVRVGSPAHAEGIRRNDVLLGMGHPDNRDKQWETAKLDNVQYILNRPDFHDFNPLKFYILRDNETLYGHMRVSTEGER